MTDTPTTGSKLVERAHTSACRATRKMTDMLTARSLSRSKMVEVREHLSDAINDIDQLISPRDQDR